MRSISSIALPLLLVLLFFISQAHALSYLDSLAVKRRPTSTVTTPNLVPSLLSRQSGGDLIKLYTCANISVNATLADLSCKNETTTTTDLVSGAIRLTTKLVCTPISVNVQIINSICICASAGVITPASLLDVQVYASDPTHNTTGSPVNLLTSYRNGAVAYTVESLLSYVNQTLPIELNKRSTSCVYPTGSVPYCSSDCSYKCPDDTRLCGNTCLNKNRDCISNMPVRRSLRDLGQVELDFRCPSGKSACALPQPAHGGSAFISDRIECLDTASDIESCGGCAFPLPGRRAGVDCTAIPHAGKVTCRSGSCHIHSCQAGYTLVGQICRPALARGTRMKPQRIEEVDYELLSIPVGGKTLLDDILVDRVGLPRGTRRGLPRMDAGLIVGVDQKKRAGKQVLAQRQLTTKQLLERKANTAKKHGVIMRFPAVAGR